jgi:hypothetical protein
LSASGSYHKVSFFWVILTGHIEIVPADVVSEGLLRDLSKSAVNYLRFSGHLNLNYLLLIQKLETEEDFSENRSNRERVRERDF